MKPEHTKPFHFDHAKAGAPYGTATGMPVEILKWDMQGNVHSILAIVGDRQECARYTRLGTNGSYADLVMLPLGMVEGKPVFVGDQLQNSKDGTIQEARRHWGVELIDWSEWNWPKLAKEYPKTRMSQAALSGAMNSSPRGMAIGHCLECVVNNAIARAIDDGDVFTREQLDKVIYAAWTHADAGNYLTTDSTDTIIGQTLK